MMRKKGAFFLKLAAGLFALLVAGGVVGTFVLKKYLPPEKVRALITDNARKFINREVRIKDVDLGVFQGLSISGLEVSEAPDFKAGMFAAAESFQLRVQLMPLLYKKIVVDRVAVEGLRLSVKKRSGGLFNFSDLAGGASPAKASAAAAAPASPMPLELNIRKTSLSDGQISYRDGGNELTVSGIEAEIRDFSLDRAFGADFSFKTSGRWEKRPVQVELAFAGEINPAAMDLDKISVSMKNFTIKAPEGALKVSGTVKGTRSLELAVKTEVSPKDLETIEADVAGTLSVSTAPAAALTVKVRTPVLKTDALNIPSLPRGLVLPPAELDTKFEWRGDDLTLKALNFKTVGASAEVSGSVKKARSKNPEANLSIAVHLDVPSLKTEGLAFLKSYQVKVPEDMALPPFQADVNLSLQGNDLVLKDSHFKTAAASADFSGSVKKFSSAKPEPDLTVSAKLNIPALKSADLAFLKTYKVEVPQDITAPAFTLDTQFHFQNDQVELKTLKFKTEGVSADVSGAVKKLLSGKPEPDLTVSAKLNIPEIKSADVAFLKAYKVEVPPDMTAPAFNLDTQFHFAGDQLDLKALHFKTQGASAEASGALSKLKSAKPLADVSVSVNLDLPALKAKDLAVLKLAKVQIPENLTLPASHIDTQFQYKGDDLTLKALRVKAEGVLVEASGSVKKLTTSPDPTMTAKINLDLPAFTSADAAFLPGFPPDLSIPASKLKAELIAGQDAVSIATLRLVSGKNDISVEGKISRLKAKIPSFDLVVKCKSFALDELTRFSAQTREMELAGSGFFALAVEGELPKPRLSGKMQFRDLGVTVAGLKLSEFTGVASFDDRLIDIPKLRGKVEGGILHMDLTIKNYVKAPDVQLEAELSEFDLGKYLTAKAALVKTKEAAPPAEEEKTAAAKPAVPPMRSKGRFTVKKLLHPNVTANNAELSWGLTGITPELGQLNGEAKLRVGGGTFEAIDKLSKQSPIVKIAIFPLLVLQKISGGVLKFIPDLTRVEFTEIFGDYSFSEGLMTLKESRLNSSVADLSTTGTIDLPTEKLDLLVWAKVGNYPAINLNVKGSVSAPAAKLGVGKTLQEPAKQLLEEPLKKVLGEPAKQLLENIFK